MRTFQRTILNLSLLTVLGLLSQHAIAGGPQLFEQSAADLGTAQAGYAAAADDASTEYTNPAGMVRIKQKEISTGVEAIALNVNYKGSSGTQVALPGLLPVPITVGTKTGVANSDVIKVVPNFHFVMPINDQWYLGTGITTPFGLMTNYPDDSVAAQYATISSMQTINVSEDVAYAVNDKFSVGAGVDVQRFDGEFDANLLNVVESVNKMNDVGLGAHAGVLFQFTPTTRVGLSYHSEVDHHSQGTGTITTSGPISIPGTAISIPIQNDSGTVTMDMPLPAWVSLGAYHDINEKWAVMSTLQYTYWNVVKSLTIEGIPLHTFPASGVEVSDQITLPMNFNNSYVASLGTTYKFTQKFMGRFGVAYDETPTSDLYRELRLPDSNKFNVAVGAHFQPSVNLGFDVGYEHVFAQAANVDKLSPLADINLSPTQQVIINQMIKGVFNNSADILGAQLTYNF